MQYFYLLGLPTIGLILNFIFKPKSRLDTIIGTFALIGLNIYLSFTGNWIMLISVYLSIVPSVLFNFILIVLLIVRLIKIKKRWRINWTILLKLFLLILTIRPIIKHGLIEYPQGVLLEYPLKNGVYYVIQGGFLSSMNSHHDVMKERSNVEIKYAVDFVKLSKFGNNINSSIEHEVKKHAIYSDTLYSPANGIVEEVKDDENDYEVENPPLNSRGQGNYIVIRNKKVFIVSAHLQKNSIMVKAGDSIKTGQPIALIGHSGQSNLPHLHIHAFALQQTNIDDGDSTEYLYPLPMYFGKNWRFLERNSFVNGE